MELKTTIKNYIIGVSVFLIYSIVTFFKGVPSVFLKNDFLLLLYSLFISITLIIIIGIIYKDKLKANYSDLLKNHKTYFEKGLKYWLIALVFMAISNLILISFNQSNLSSNEEVIRGLFAVSPILVFLSAVLIAPILEELVFRQAFRDIFSNNFLFILFSSLTFGAFHVIGSATTFIEFLYIIPYAIPGVAFALLLKETNNIFVPIGFHLLHNGILISLQFVILIFG